MGTVNRRGRIINFWVVGEIVAVISLRVETPKLVVGELPLPDERKVWGCDSFAQPGRIQRCIKVTPI